MRLAFGVLKLPVALLIASAFCAGDAAAQDPGIVFADQGSQWTAVTRADFYTRDQGSKMIPLAWLQALRQDNGRPFLADSLSRYGYLPNPANSNGLPVGFAASGPTGAQTVGMTCSACHTRQITAEGKIYRIDGGPAIVDFQSLLSDLDSAVGRVLATDPAFTAFAAEVLGSADPSAPDVTALRKDVELWFQRFHTLMTRALPTPPWGPARLDAVAMIFNRLTGLDLGPPPSLLIPDNIKKAEAPVRYPFLWNAPVQDKTEWTGFADNGSDLLALSRNVGEVLGVFGTFEPTQATIFINFLNNNSANFDGLIKLEDLVKKIGPPKWPWLIDSDLAARGKGVFARSTAEGGCVECHGIKDAARRSLSPPTWATPIQNVGTDTRQWDILGWKAKSGALKGVFIPFVTSPLKEEDLAFNVLATSVIGSIAQHTLLGSGARSTALVEGAAESQGGRRDTSLLNPAPLPPSLRDLAGAFRVPGTPEPPPEVRIQGMDLTARSATLAPTVPRGSYESRVLQGIWATAPYLHNGSVPTLAELLKPPAQRVPEFKVGSAYDTEAVGLAREQAQFDYTMNTMDCSDLNSGNSRCGHDFGTRLSDDDKRALLEYLKTL
jgi:hypothetical protein